MSTADPDHHDEAARLDAICYVLLRSNTIRYDDHGWQSIVLIVDKFWTVQNFSTLNTITTISLKVCYG